MQNLLMYKFLFLTFIKMTAILIGFNYSDSVPGIIVDLYHAYKLCQAWATDIRVITDMTTEAPTAYVSRAIIDGLVGSDISTFITMLQDKGYLYTVTHQDKPLRLQQCLEDISSDKCLVYYTGHGLQDSFILPNGTRLPIQLFQESLFGRLPISAEILWIMDCCYPSGLSLPYKLQQGYWRYREEGIPERRHVICLSSSDERHEKSVATRQGSVFSRALFELLRSGIRGVDKIQTELNTKVRASYDEYKVEYGRLPRQTVSLYASHPDLREVWPWVVNSSVWIDWATNTVHLKLN